MDSIIQIFRMNELSVETRVSIIKELGNAIDNQMAMNITPKLVFELCIALDPELEPEFRSDPRYSYHLK